MKRLLCSSDTRVTESINKNDLVRLWLLNDVNVYDEIKTPIVNIQKVRGVKVFDTLIKKLVNSSKGDGNSIIVIYKKTGN